MTEQVGNKDHKSHPRYFKADGERQKGGGAVTDNCGRDWCCTWAVHGGDVVVTPAADDARSVHRAGNATKRYTVSNDRAQLIEPERRASRLIAIAASPR